MLGHARRSTRRVPWRLVWVALGLLGLPAVIAILTIVLLSAPTASGSKGRPVLSSALAGSADSAACSRTNRSQVNSTRAGAGVTLIPPGPTAVLLCRYGPDGTRVLERSITRRATVSQLGFELNALPPAKGTYNCPSDDGESITADFSYASAAANPVSVGLSGCQSMTNGHVNRLGLDRPAIGQLAGLIPWQGTIKGRLEPCAGSSDCSGSDQVAITHSVGTQYADVSLQRGSFSFRVEPGRYHLALLARARHGHQRVLATASVRVRQNRTTRMSFRLEAR